ncbi:MOSC domain-containing protein [Streptomyces sp. NPDC051776]|uniref:MOSC domain-containing protein n=1 Tax=Streptomyces sp. NPDC051776 TaxID=3155414 RepID=UPI00342493C0
MKILSVNVGSAEPAACSNAPCDTTGIDKQPVETPVQVSPPGRPGVGGSGVAGDAVCNLRSHGGDDRAVYAFAREDLDGWESELGRRLPNGTFGENLTTLGIDVRAALVGERWRIGPAVVLEVTGARIPCRTFAQPAAIGRRPERGAVSRGGRRALASCASDGGHTSLCTSRASSFAPCEALCRTAHVRQHRVLKER